jgi:hypothetical protein
MSAQKRCSSYRKPMGLSLGQGVGYCDPDDDLTSCGGDMHFCEKQDSANIDSTNRPMEKIMENELE